MKYIITFIFLLSCTISHGQPYQSMFGQFSTKWTMWVAPALDLADMSIHEFWVEKDTIVNGHTYKRIKTTLHLEYDDFLLREDLDSGKVWYRQLQTSSEQKKICDTSELLLLDYNLKVGDTFVTLKNHFFPRIDTVQSVTIKNGRKHIVFKAYEPALQQNLEIIEGVGINRGFRYLSACNYYEFPLPADIFLLCSKKDDQTVYINDWSNSCFPLSVEGKPSIHPITIFPNPSSNIVSIIFKNPVSDQNVLLVINQVGQTVQREIIETGCNSKKIDISNLPNGVYHLIIPDKFITNIIKN